MSHAYSDLTGDIEVQLFWGQNYLNGAAVAEVTGGTLKSKVGGKLKKR